jgi:hypothetical protein
MLVNRVYAAALPQPHLTHPFPSIQCAYENQCAPLFSARTHRKLFLDVVFNLLYGTLYFDVHIF